MGLELSGLWPGVGRRRVVVSPTMWVVGRARCVGGRT